MAQAVTMRTLPSQDDQQKTLHLGEAVAERETNMMWLNLMLNFACGARSSADLAHWI